MHLARVGSASAVEGYVGGGGPSFLVRLACFGSSLAAHSVPCGGLVIATPDCMRLDSSLLVSKTRASFANALRSQERLPAIRIGVSMQELSCLGP